MAAINAALLTPEMLAELANSRAIFQAYTLPALIANGVQIFYCPTCDQMVTRPPINIFDHGHRRGSSYGPWRTDVYKLR